MARLALAVAVAAALLAVGAQAAPAADPWCGSGETAENRLPDVVAGPLVHLVYAYPSDGADQFAQMAPAIVGDVEAVDAWWREQDPARTPRFDLASFPGCSGFGALDIGVVRLAATGADLQPRATRFATIARSVPTFGRWTKVVVYYDGPLDDPSLCGTAAGSADPCSPTLSAPTSVQALFGAASVRLTVRTTGRGRVAGAGVACPGRCVATVAAGRVLTLRARPARGLRLAAWSGACRGVRATCSLTPQADVAAAARFVHTR